MTGNFHSHYPPRPTHPTPPPNLSLSSLSFVLIFTGFFYNQTLLNKRCIIPSSFFTLECDRSFFCLVSNSIYLSYLSVYCHWIPCWLFISRHDHYLSNLFPFRSRLTIHPLATSRSIIPPACPAFGGDLPWDLLPAGPSCDPDHRTTSAGSSGCEGPAWTPYSVSKAEPSLPSKATTVFSGP